MLDALDTLDALQAAWNKDPVFFLLRFICMRKIKRGLCQTNTINSPTSTLHLIEVIIRETHGRDNLFSPSKSIQSLLMRSVNI